MELVSAYTTPSPPYTLSKLPLRPRRGTMTGAGAAAVAAEAAAAAAAAGGGSGEPGAAGLSSGNLFAEQQQAAHQLAGRGNAGIPRPVVSWGGAVAVVPGFCATSFLGLVCIIGTWMASILLAFGADVPDGVLEARRWRRGARVTGSSSHCVQRPHVLR